MTSTAALVGEAHTRTAWNEWLCRFPRDRVDVYFLEEYVRLYEYQGYSAECFLYEEGDAVFAFPHLRALRGNHGAAHDVTTPYGYGGPISSRQDEAFYARGWDAMRETLAASGAHGVFVRFHPVLANHALVPKSVHLRHCRTTIAVELTSSVDDIWTKQLDSCNRQNIHCAERRGLEFVVDDRFDHLEEFHEIYADAMERLHADPVYWFNDAYFRRFSETLREESTLCLVTQAGEVIAGALLMFSGPYSHCHLSGSRRDSLRLRPNNLLYYRTALEARNRGARLMHMGGGRSNSPDDSLLAFKRHFGGLSYDYYTTEIALA
jgi:serine/alanine adding enzyme